MKDIIISSDGKGGTAILTVYSPRSHYGVPVLRISGAWGVEDGDYGPADLLGTFKDRQLFSADMVYMWGKNQMITDEAREAARKFLSQWPEGPQLGAVM